MLNKINKIIEYGLYLLVFLLPWQTRYMAIEGSLNGGYWEYGTISLYATDLLLIFIIILFVIKIWPKEKTATKSLKTFRDLVAVLKEQKLEIILGLFFLVLLASCLFAADKVLAFYKFFIFLLGSGLFFLIACAKYDKIKLIWFFLAGIFIQASLGIWQFLSQNSFANKWFGMAAHQSGELGVSVVETLNNERWLRAYGGLDHPNIFGALMGLGILFCLYLLFTTKNKKAHLLIYFFTIFYSAALFFSFSRNAALSLSISIVFILALAAAKKDLLAQKNILKILFLFFLTGFVLYLIFANLIQARLNENLRLEQKSSEERLTYASYSLDIINKNLFSGVGLGNYTLALSKTVRNEPNYFYQPAHNAYLLIFSEVGISGFIFVIIILTYFFYLSFHQNLPPENFYINIALLTYISINFFFDHWWWSLNFGILLTFFMLGFIYKNCLKNNE